MRIRKDMINWLEVLKAIPKGEGGQGGALLGPYMEYPDSDKPLHYVMQWHIRGRSVHTDWRMEVDDHLIGWTVLTPGGIPKSVTSLEDAKKMATDSRLEFATSKKNHGFRAETKARQPKVWLNVQGVMKAGEVGATKEHEGVFLIIDQGEVYFGAQKPYFHEYFVKSSKNGSPFDSSDWTRIVVRAVNVSVLDPETKEPKEGTELMWRVLVPGDQVPYAIDRGFKKKWVPPKGYIPVPPSWRKGEKYDTWEKWIKETWAGRRGSTEPTKTKEEKSISLEELPFADYKDFADCVRKNKDKANPEAYCGAIKHKVEDSGGSFIVQYLSYMGQVVVRGIPNQTWFLRIRDKDKIYSWIADLDFTKYSPVALRYEGTVTEKQFTFEGDIPPNSEYNPSKTLVGKMSIIDRGSCGIEEKTVDDARSLQLAFHGKQLNGNYNLSQEEKSSPIYTIERLSLLELESARFVLQLHEIQTESGLKTHWDIRISKGFEFNLWGNPLALNTEGTSFKAIFKLVKNVEPWMKIEKEKTPMKVGNLDTFVTPIDEGEVTLIDQSPPRFFSMLFKGKKLSGYFVYLQRDGLGVFERAKIPHPLSNDGNKEDKGRT